MRSLGVGHVWSPIFVNQRARETIPRGEARNNMLLLHLKIDIMKELKYGYVIHIQPVSQLIPSKLH